MADVRFSLAPPQTGDENFNAIDVIGVPDIEWLRKFSEGIVGVAQSCYTDFFDRQSAGLDPDVSEIFTSLAENNNSIPSWGLPALESTLVKSIFETQKPYIELVLVVLDLLVALEDIIAVLKAGTYARSLKPKTNYKSLYTKLNGIKDYITKIKQEASPAYSSFKDIPFSQRVAGIDAETLLKQYENKPKFVEENAFGDFTFVTISEFYSTGEFIPSVQYDYTYIDIVDQNVEVNVPAFDFPEPRNDDNPPVIIFDMWVDPQANGDNIKRLDEPVDLPNDWDITTKWFGEWEGYTKNVSGFTNEYRSILIQQINEELDRNGIDDPKLRQESIDIFESSLPPYSELYDDLQEGNFKRNIARTIDSDFNVSNLYTLYTDPTNTFDKKKDSIADVWRNESNQFGYKPRKLNGNWIDPEVDYDLRLVRIFPQNAKVRPNPSDSIRLTIPSKATTSNNIDELSGSNPLVFNYGDDTLVSQLLGQEDYDFNTPKFNFPTNNYTIDKKFRSYPAKEKRERAIIDKIRKDNSQTIEKLILGRISLNADFERIVKDIENEGRLVKKDENDVPIDKFYRYLYLAWNVKPDSSTLIYQNQGNPIKRSDVKQYLIDKFIERIERDVNPALLEEFGGSGFVRTILDNSFTVIFDDVLNNSETYNYASFISLVNLGNPQSSNTSSNNNSNAILNFLGLGDQSSTYFAERRILNSDLPRPDRLYGTFIRKDVWRRNTLFGGLPGIPPNPNNPNDSNSIKNLSGYSSSGNLPSPFPGPIVITNLQRGSFIAGDLIPDPTNLKFISQQYEGTNPTSNNSPGTPEEGDTLQITDFEDQGIFYIVEGVYKKRKDFLNQQFDVSLTGASPGSNASGERFYKYGKSSVRGVRSLIAAISKFAQFGGTFIPNIINESSKALSILKNPYNLIFEILMEQLSETFAAFDPDITSKFQQLASITDNEEKRQFIKNDPTLKNFIALDREFNYRFIFDGAGVMSVFGKNFGIGIKDILPKIIVENNGLQSSFCSEAPPDRGGDATGNYDENGNPINPKGEYENEYLRNGGGNVITDRIPEGTEFSIVDVEYSTGNFIEGINYKYYYITLDNQDLVNKATAYIEQADNLFDPAEKIRLQLLATEEIQKALVKDPSNRFLNDQLNNLISNEGVQVNMIIQFIINIIMVPIKIVICIIEYIVDFFTNLKITDLPTEIPKFLGFEWILDFFKPSGVLKLLGIELNPDLSPLYLTQALKESNNFKFDVSKIFQAPFLGKMPTYSAEQYPNIVNGGPKMLLTMGGVFCFLEGIINEILCFLFNIFNLDKLFPCPELNLSRFINETLSGDDIEKLVSEADYNFLNQLSDIRDDSAFIFDVELDDGEIVKGLNRSELQAFVASNRNLKFQYNFDINEF